MKGLRRLCTLVLALGMAVMPYRPAKALETTSMAESAKDGVVQVNTVLVDDKNERHLICGGSGFIIGDTEGTEYVITCNHTVNPGESVKTAAYEYLEIPDTDDAASRMSLATEVVIEGDVVLSASVLTASSELDMAVLQLPQPIYTRTPLKILTNADYDVENLPYVSGESVYTFGFPEAVFFNSETLYYSDSQIVSSEGTIIDTTVVDNLQVIENDTTTDYNNYGGPLVNSNGYVIGMNLPVVEGSNSCALDSTKIAKVLDGLGVSYTKVSNTPAVQEEVQTESVQQDADTQADTPATVVTPDTKKSRGFSESLLMIICIVGALAAAGIIIALIMFFIHKDNKPKTPDTVIKKTYNGPTFDFDSTANAGNTSNIYDINTASKAAPKAPARAKASVRPAQAANDETTILSQMPGNGETELLSEELTAPQQLGTLIRKRNSEEISLGKSDFVIGKDLRADYCIKNNTSISRKHALITGGRNGAYIQDCNSTNGTFINGTKIESGRLVLLNNGDIIKMSNEEFEYQA